MMDNCSTTLPINQIICGDFLDNTLPDKSVQLIIADPPYFEVKGAFDFVWASFDDYLKDVERWAVECKRVLADNGTLFWWGMDRKIAYAQTILDKRFQLISTLVWEKPSNPNEWDTRRSFPERGAERILMYDNGTDISGLEAINANPELFCTIKKYLDDELDASGVPLKKIIESVGSSCSHYFGFSKRNKTQFAIPTQEMYVKLREHTGRFTREYENLRQEYENLRQEYENLRQEYESLRRPFNNRLKLTDVIRFSREKTKFNHDTVKPETLTRALITTCSRPNDIILAPFAGSGTECAMAAKEGRRFIGYDINQKYVDMATKRCRAILSQPMLIAQ